MEMQRPMDKDAVSGLLYIPEEIEPMVDDHDDDPLWKALVEAMSHPLVEHTKECWPFPSWVDLVLGWHCTCAES